MTNAADSVNAVVYNCVTMTGPAKYSAIAVWRRGLVDPTAVCARYSIP